MRKKLSNSLQSKRKAGDNEILKLDRALNTLIECNRAIVRSTREEELLDDICWILVEVGGYHLAWVGYTQKGMEKAFRRAGQKGYEEGHLEMVGIMWADTDWDQGPSGRAVRPGKPHIPKKTRTVPHILPSRAEAIKRSCASSVAIPLIGRYKFFGVLNIYAMEPNAFDEQDVNLLTELANSLAYGIETLRIRAEHSRAEKEIKQSARKIRRTLEDTVNALASAVEARDSYTAGHQRRVSSLASATAREMVLSKKQIEGIQMAGVIHDVGKIYVPSKILSKRSWLTAAEFDIVKTHTQIGYDILRSIEFPWPVAEIILQHHERLDGSGYPSGLLKEDLLEESRILAVADVVEAISSHRSYRPALGVKDALDEISKNSGALYDSDVVDACVKLFTKKSFKFE